MTGLGKAQQNMSIWAKDKGGVGVEDNEPLMVAEKEDGEAKDEALRAE